MVFKKRASLSLSVNAIVVIVIAFVVLGLGLTFTQTLFGGAERQLGEAIGIPKFAQEANSKNTITLSDNIDVGIGKQPKFTFQYYNKDSSTHDNVMMQVYGCNSVDSPGTTTTDPTMSSSVASSVGPSEVFEFKTVVTIASGTMNAGLYICTVGAISSGDIDNVLNTDFKPYDSKTVYLNVKS